MQRPTLEGRSILIVEDEPLIALDLMQAFESTGAELTTAATVQHAMRLILREPLSAVILDHALPDGDSSALCELLTERAIPFVVYSGFGLTGEAACKNAPFLTKPANPEVIVTLVQKMILHHMPQN